MQKKSGWARSERVGWRKKLEGFCSWDKLNGSLHCKPTLFLLLIPSSFLSRCKANVTELFSCLRREDDMWELYSTCKILVVLTKGFSHVRTIW